MRCWGAVVLGLAVTTTAGAQVLMVGAAGTITNEINPESRPGESFHSNNTITPAFFVGVPASSDTLVRLRTFDLPHEQVVADGVAETHLRALTVGVDYLMQGAFGKTLFSGGLGGYKLDVSGSNPPAGLEDWEFGWFVGVGEWFAMTQHSQFTLELNYHNTNHPGRPQILSLSAGLAFTF